jgi:hypothetical protein
LFISAYLWTIWHEGKEIKYDFTWQKIFRNKINIPDYVFHTLIVTRGQLEYEFKHLQNKLFDRDYEQYEKNNHDILLFDDYDNPEYDRINANPLFHITAGNIEHWEKIKWIIKTF